MKIVFVSNFYNHHQSELSRELYRITDGSFAFVSTEEMSEERKKMGYGYEEIPLYVWDSNTSKEEYSRCKNEILNAEVVIIGSAPQDIYQDRLKSGKLTFFYSERVFKEKKENWKKPIRVIKQYYKLGRYKNTYLLAASAYAPMDYAELGLFKNRAFKFGYFPPLRIFEQFDDFLHKKEMNSILWVGRLIGWKHPEAVLFVAKELQKENIPFRIRIVGDGELRTTLEDQIAKEKLDGVDILGAKKPEEVRELMELSQIYLFTSDYQEGWGAVLNEAMNSGMCVIASKAAGSTPYLICGDKEKTNGLPFASENWADLSEKVKYLLQHSEEAQNIAREAYVSIKNTWNAKVVANRFWNIAQRLLVARTKEERTEALKMYVDGPLSFAPSIDDGRR